MNNDFMAQFDGRLEQEPNPQWYVLKREPFPWLEIGWALAGSLMLFLRFTELRFGFFTLLAHAQQLIAGVPTVALYAGLAGAYFVATMWIVPMFRREAII